MAINRAFQTWPNEYAHDTDTVHEIPYQTIPVAPPPARSALELARNRAQLRRGTESFLDWTLRRVDWHLGGEPADERDRR